MTIICGVDFSENSLRSLSAAAELAAHMQLPLHVVHAVRLRSERVGDESDAEVVAWAERRLRHEADRLRAITARIDVHCEVGSPDQVLLATAARADASLIVVAAFGHREGGSEQLGSQVDRVAQLATVPVLVVRSPGPFEAWVHKVRPLRVLVGVDASPSADAALQFVHELTKFGPCDVTAAHLYWPPQEFQRLGLTGVRSLIDPDPAVTQVLERELAARLSHLLTGSKARISLEPHMGRVGDRLAALATEQHADLIVVGSHQRNPMDRVLHGSVSRGVLHCSQVSVACVPVKSSVHSEQPPEFRSVLAATDFSATGNAAVPLAYSTVATGGTVHLVHVVESRAGSIIDPHDILAADTDHSDSSRYPDSLAQLKALIPKLAARRSITSRLHILESNDAPAAISQAAERFAASMICLGTHGRGGVSKLLLGSVAQGVLSRSYRPVLLARSRTE